MNGRVAKALRGVAKQLGLDYKVLKRNYKLVHRSDRVAMENLRRIRR